jgi:hypothetical protein
VVAFGRPLPSKKLFSKAKGLTIGCADEVSSLIALPAKNNNDDHSSSAFVVFCIEVTCK